jgi:hypothetical protein
MPLLLDNDCNAATAAAAVQAALERCVCLSQQQQSAVLHRGLLQLCAYMVAALLSTDCHWLSKHKVAPP